MKNLLVKETMNVLAYNNIPFKRKELTLDILTHSAFPSLRTITEVLDQMQIDNQALLVPKELETIDQLPTSFMAVVNLDTQDEIATVRKKGTNLEVFIAHLGKRYYTKSEFLKIFNGVVICIRENRISIINKVLTIGKKIAFFLCCIALIGYFMYISKTWTPLVHFVLSIIGLVMSSAIIKKDWGIHTKIGAAICSDTDSKKDCSSVISSKGSMLFNKFKLSDLALTYFLSITILSLLLLVTGNSFLVIFGSSILMTPIIAYSLYYQSFILKKWCNLCLIIVGILSIQASIAFYLDINYYELWMHKEVLLLIPVIFLGSYIGWTKFSLILNEMYELRELKIDYLRFKKNYTLFKELLFQEKQLDDSSLENVNMDAIQLGNKEASLSIIIVSNPLCKPCGLAHEMIKRLLLTYKDKVSITIIFKPTDDITSDSFKICGKLLEIKQDMGMEKCLEAMEKIYGEDSPTDWFKTWGTSKNSRNHLDALYHQLTWSQINDIQHTPTLFIGGRKFPKTYTFESLEWFIEDLIEDDTIHLKKSKDLHSNMIGHQEKKNVS